MKKLELKHIAPYLPYKLKAKFPETNRKNCKKYVVGTIGYLFSNCSIGCYDTVNSYPDNFKPILRPLWQYKDINSDAMNDLNCDLPDQILINQLAHRDADLSCIPYSTAEICFKNHIDIFGLIDKNLAIPIE
jgi:hypothetical protein